MRQIFRIGVLMSALLIAAAGCASMDWLKSSSGRKETASDQRKDDERVSARSDQTDGQTKPVHANSSAPAQVDTVHVLFASDRWDLNNTARADLLSVIKKLRENPKLIVNLEGYADSVGSRDYNLQLSQKRVEMVRRFLVEKGVEAPRIRSAGLGALPDGGTEAERAKNRRVTVKLSAGE